MKNHIVIAAITLGLALAPASVSWAQTSGTNSSGGGSSKMGTGAGKGGSHGMSNHPGGNPAKSQKMHNNNNGQ